MIASIAALLALPSTPIYAENNVDSAICSYSITPRVIAHEISKRVSVGNGIYATISGTYTADSAGNVKSADFRVTSVTGNRKVLSFSTSISGKHIYYTLSVSGGTGTKTGFLL